MCLNMLHNQTQRKSQDNVIDFNFIFAAYKIMIEIFAYYLAVHS